MKVKLIGLVLLLGSPGCSNPLASEPRCHEEASGFSWGARRREKVPITDLSLHTNAAGTLVMRATRADGTIAAKNHPGSYAVLPVTDVALVAIAADAQAQLLAMAGDGSAFTNRPSEDDLWIEGIRLQTTETISRLAAGAAGEFWAVGSAGLVAHFDGQDWSESHPVVEDLVAVGADAASVWVVSRGAVLRGDTSGNFEDLQAPGTAAFSAIAALSSEQLWVVGEGGYWLEWNGSDWTVIDSGTTADLTAVWADRDQGVWAAGDGVVQHLPPGSAGAVAERLPLEVTTQRFTALAGARSPRLAGIGTAPDYQITVWGGTAEGSLFSRQESTATICD